MDFKMCWHGEEPSDEIKEAARKDLAESFYHDGDCDIPGGPGGLCLHHVFLTEDMYGPCVFVWGKEEQPDTFHCEYLTHVEWSSAPALQH